MGVNTTILVSVLATTARAISVVPSTAASAGVLPKRICRMMFSRTTIEFVTRIPTVIPRAIRVMILSVKPAKSTSRKVAITEVGMATAATTVIRIL